MSILQEWACEGCDPGRLITGGPHDAIYAQDDEDDERHGTGGYLLVCPYSVDAGQAQFCTRFLAAVEKGNG